MAPPNDKPRRTRTRQSKPAAETLEAKAETGDGDTKALEQVQVYTKLDRSNPESPVVPLTSAVNAAPRDPEEQTVKAGDTVAAHEAHTLTSSDARISERIEQESGDKGLPTDVIARRQHEDAARAEADRLDIEGDSVTARASSLLTDAELIVADQAREIRERQARDNKEAAKNDAA